MVRFHGLSQLDTQRHIHVEQNNFLGHFNGVGPPPRSIVVRASARGAGGPVSIPDRVTQKTYKNGRFALLSLALGIKELGIRLGGSESV